LEEGWAMMAELQREGKVRWIGVSNFGGRTDASRTGNRADHFFAAANTRHTARGRGGDSPFCRREGLA